MNTKSEKSSSLVLSLVISVYKNIEFLDLVLESVCFQSFKNFEVIVAEDCEEQEMQNYIKEKKKNFPFVLKHVSHEDKGFRKNKILNKAILISESDFLIFIDGDCLLHPKFIENYAKMKNLGDCFMGRRAELNQKITQEIISLHNFNKINTLKILFNIEKFKKFKEVLYIPFLSRKKHVSILGSNFGIKKDLLIKINGFDEDYVNPCIGEDVDIERRLKLLGNVKFVSMKNKAIQYHLFHKRFEREDIYKINKALFEEKSKNFNYKCIHGIIKE